MIHANPPASPFDNPAVYPVPLVVSRIVDGREVCSFQPWAVLTTQVICNADDVPYELKWDYVGGSSVDVQLFHHDLTFRHVT